MPKIVWLDQNKVREVPVPNHGFMSLGRGTDNDITLSDPQVKHRHARLVCDPNGCLLKDMKSGKSLHVNGNAVNTRFLQNGDVIRIGNHVLEYLSEDRMQDHTATSDTDEAHYLFESALRLKQTEPLKPSQERAFLRYTSGPSKDHIQAIDRPLVPIGDPDGYYAAISHRTSGYYLLNLGKGMYVNLNEEPVHGGGVVLKNGDIITLGGDERIEIRIFQTTKTLS